MERDFTGRIKHILFIMVIISLALGTACSNLEELLDIKNPLENNQENGKKEVKDVEKPPIHDIEGQDLPDNYSYLYREELEKRMIDLVNQHRKANGLHPLVEKADLRTSARYKSLSSLQLNYFAHENPNFSGENMDYLIWKVFKLGYYRNIGENLGYIASSRINDEAIDEIFENLKESPGHNENMLRDSFDFIGVGVVYSRKPGTYYKETPTIIVTQHFGRYK